MRMRAYGRIRDLSGRIAFPMIAVMLLQIGSEPTLGACLSPLFKPQTTVSVGRIPASVELTDFTRDGKLDLAVVADDNISILPGDGIGGFLEPITTPTGRQPGPMAVGDYNGDGDLDLAVFIVVPEELTIFLGNGTGGFSAGTILPVPRAGTLIARDFNQDGKLDLAVTRLFGDTVDVFLGLGGGSFGPADPYAVGMQPLFMAVTDFDRDGVLDLAVANTFVPTVSILLGIGDGSFAPQSIVVIPGQNDLRSLASGDLNHDGSPDLIVINAFIDSAIVLLGNGDGSFGLPDVLRVGGQPIGVAIADLNGDGDLDFVVANANDDSLSVFAGRGDGTFGSEETFAAGDAPTLPVLGDLDRDGSLDLAVGNEFDSTISILLNACEIEKMVGIDIKPGSLQNTINRRSGGSTPVAVLSSPSFDAFGEIDQESLTFGRSGEEVSLSHCSNAAEDVNGDGLLDMACHFAIHLAAFRQGDTVGVLRGRTIAGVSLVGRDSVRIVGGRIQDIPAIR